MAETGDAVVAQRRTIARFVALGKRLGYSLWLLAMVAFFVLFATDFDGPFVTLVVFALIAGCVVLLPAIVLGYAVRAADREDREHGRT